MISPLSKPPPPQPESSTAAGCLEIMRFMKMQVLPDPDSDALGKCDDNSATRVLAAAVYSQHTQQFRDAIQAALETFKDEISSLTEDIHSKAYKNYVTAYHKALVPVWNLAHFANIHTVMETVADKELKEITTMATRLKPASPNPKVVPPKSKIPDLETITDAMLCKFPGKSLPELSICEKIGDVFSNLSTGQTAYAEAAQGLAELQLYSLHNSIRCY